MNDKIVIFLAFIEGLALGILFFGGHRMTAKWTEERKHGQWWAALSFVARWLMVVAGFYLITEGNVQKLLLCLSEALA